MNSLLIWLRISLLISQKARHRSINNNGGDLMAADFNSCQYLSRKCGPLEYTVHGRKTTLKFRHVYICRYLWFISKINPSAVIFRREIRMCSQKSTFYSYDMHNHLDFLFAPPLPFIQLFYIEIKLKYIHIFLSMCMHLSCLLSIHGT